MPLPASPGPRSRSATQRIQAKLPHAVAYAFGNVFGEGTFARTKAEHV
jgi:hypothetical protein